MTREQWIQYFRELFSEPYIGDDVEIDKPATAENMASSGKTYYTTLLDCFASVLYEIYSTIDGFMDKYPDINKIMIDGKSNELIVEALKITGFNCDLDDYWVGYPSKYAYAQLAKDYTDYLKALSYRGAPYAIGYAAEKSVREMLLMLASYAISAIAFGGSPLFGEANEDYFANEDLGDYNTFLKRAVSVIRVSSQEKGALNLIAGKYSGKVVTRLDKLVQGIETGDESLTMALRNRAMSVLLAVYNKYAEQLIGEGGTYTFQKKSIEGVEQEGTIFGYRTSLPSLLSSELNLPFTLVIDVVQKASEDPVTYEIITDDVAQRVSGSETPREILRGYTGKDISTDDDVLNYYMAGSKPAGINLRWSLLAELAPIVYNVKSGGYFYEIAEADDIYKNSRKVILRGATTGERGVAIQMDNFESGKETIAFPYPWSDRAIQPISYKGIHIQVYPSDKKMEVWVVKDDNTLKEVDVSWDITQLNRWYGSFNKYQFLKTLVDAGEEAGQNDSSSPETVVYAEGLSFSGSYIGIENEVPGILGYSGIGGQDKDLGPI